MSQRISLTRIIALGWYGFRQIFDVDDNALISGAFGTGKSALLDLLQYVLLCDHWKANRAAAGNARGRDLVGYCLGDTNQGQDQRHFLRRSGATIIGLEFSRPAERGKEPRRETWGVRIEFSSPDASPKQTYFCIPTRLEYSSIASDGKRLLPEDEFRAWIRREFGNEFLFSLQREYLAEMAAPRHLNFDSSAFLRTFPKAIAFEPEENIEKFIRDFILEESPLNVSDVRTAVRAYDDIRKRLERQEDEADCLRRISEQNNIYQSSRRAEATFSHLFDSLSLLQSEERLERNRAELKRLEDENAEDVRALNKATDESKRVAGLLADVRFQIQKDPAQIQFDELDRKKRELEQKVGQLRSAQQSIQKQLNDRHYRWLQWLKHGGSLPLEGLGKALTIDEADLSKLRAGLDADRLAAMQRLSAHFNEIRNNVRDLLQPLKVEIEANEKRLRQLAEDLENISKGQAPGAFPLFTALRQKLGSRVEQLSRLIEVKPESERWWPALELFLGRNRWVLVVNDAADYRDALDVLKKSPPGREAESLLNPAEARLLRSADRENSLLTKVEVAHPIARLYVEHLLGDVHCVENLEQLEQTDAARAITPEGIFKQTPLRRRLKPAASVELTLGKEGLARLRAAKLREQNEARIAFESAKRRLQDLNSWLDNGLAGGLADAALPDRSAELPQLPAMEDELRTIRETIALLKTPEREARQKQLLALEEQHRELTKQIGAREKATQAFELQTRPYREAVERGFNEIRELALKAEESRVQLSIHFSGILDSDLDSQREHFRQRFPKWNDCFAEAQREKADAGRRADAARVGRRSEREKLAASRDERGNLRHPEYQHDFPVEEDSNDLWDSRLKALDEIELKKSRQLASDCKKEWERRLQENVLNELNARLTKAQNEIRLLDRYLSQPIGKFRYRIKPRRDTAGYAMIWTLLDGGFEATDPLLAAVRESEIQRAKEELMRSVDAADSADDRARRLLDYRNYHHYDIEMVPSDNPEAPPISLSRSGRNLSGGENQAPFFISMLAAFRRVYDRGDRTSTRSQQLGLVVMDEAFSKLSGDGIEDCLALARSFQLQLIMAFPPERLGVMVPHAQTVVMCQKEVQRDSRGYVTNITNYPLIVTMAEAVEALS